MYCLQKLSQLPDLPPAVKSKYALPEKTLDIRYQENGNKGRAHFAWLLVKHDYCTVAERLGRIATKDLVPNAFDSDMLSAVRYYSFYKYPHNVFDPNADKEEEWIQCMNNINKNNRYTYKGKQKKK